MYLYISAAAGGLGSPTPSGADTHGATRVCQSRCTLVGSSRDATMRCVGRHVSEALGIFCSGFDLKWLVEDFQVALTQELDFTGEAKHCDRTRRMFAHRPDVKVRVG